MRQCVRLEQLEPRFPCRCQTLMERLQEQWDSMPFMKGGLPNTCFIDGIWALRLGTLCSRGYEALLRFAVSWEICEFLKIGDPDPNIVP